MKISIAPPERNLSALKRRFCENLQDKKDWLTGNWLCSIKRLVHQNNTVVPESLSYSVSSAYSIMIDSNGHNFHPLHPFSHLLRQVGITEGLF